MVGRNEDKMKDKLNEIALDCRPGDKDFKTMYVVADFGKMFKIEDYKTIVARKLARLDIGVLVLNAGYAEKGPFHLSDDQVVEGQCQINAVHVLYLFKAIIN